MGPRARLVVPDDAGNWFRQVPLDVLRAGSRLRTRGWDVGIDDLRLTIDSPEGEVDVVAVATAVTERAQCYPLRPETARSAVAWARAHHPGTTVAVVGPHVTHLPEATLELTGADLAIPGETEAALALGLPEVVSGRATPPVLHGAWSGEVTLDVVDPAPLDLDLISVAAYQAEVPGAGGTVGRSRSGLLQTAKGCPYGCDFCHLPYGTRLRPRALASVLDDVDRYVAAGTTDLFVIDYVFGLGRTHYDQLCEGLVRRPVRWFGQTRPEVVERSEPERWREAGCWAMWLGVESLDVAGAGIGKKLTRASIDAAIARLRGAGITPLVFLMVGLRNEDEASIDHLASWLAAWDLHFVVSQLTLRPGTLLFAAEAGAHLGRPARNWDEVEAVNAAYRAALAIDPAQAAARLEGSSTNIFNLA